MPIPPVNPIPVAPPPAAPERPTAPAAVPPVAPVEEVEAQEPARPSAEEELRRIATDAHMEVRVLDLPDDNVVVYRLVDPGTGNIVREIPSEDLTRQLAGLRAQRLNELA